MIGFRGGGSKGKIHLAHHSPLPFISEGPLSPVYPLPTRNCNLPCHPAETLLRILKSKNICFSTELSGLSSWFLEINNNNAKTSSSLIISHFSFIFPLNSQLLCKETGCCMKTAWCALTQGTSIYSIENDDTNNSNACLVFGRCHWCMTHHSKSKQEEWNDALKWKTKAFYSSHGNKTVNFQVSTDLFTIQRNFTVS